MSLNAVLGMVNRASASIDQSRDTVTQGFQLQLDSLENQATAIQQGAAAKSVIEMQAAKASMQAQNNTRKAAAALGNNMDVNSEIVTQISANFRNAALKASQQAADISKYKGATGIVGSFAGGLYDMLFDDQEQATLAAYNKEVETNASILQNMNAITIGTASAQNAMKETHTTATMAALQEQITAESNFQLERLRAEAGNIKIAEVNQLMSMNSAQINMHIAAENAKGAAESRALAAEQRRMLMQQKEDAKAAEQDLLNLYNEGVRQSNVPDAPEIKDIKLLNQLMKIGDKRAEDFIRMGLRQRVTGEASIAADPFGLMEFGRTNPSALNPAQRRIYESAEEALVEATSPEAIGAALGLEMNTMQQKAEAAKQIAEAKKDKGFMEQLARTTLRNRFNPSNIIQPGDKRNPYSLVDYEFFKGATFLDENGFTREYVKPLAEAGDATNGKPINFEPSQLFNLGADAVLKGMSLDEVVAGITTTARAGVAANNAQNNYTWMGLERQSSANMTVNWKGDIKRPNLGANAPMGRVTDLTNPTDVTATLNSILASRRAFESQFRIQKALRDNSLDIMRAMNPQGIMPE